MLNSFSYTRNTNRFSRE
ncbi:hypothetical protein CGLO_09529 [Colletotrichum gloeosporioides Cg-14]|uniref:Uncharacterized protein n=1 Tax=Colletotrichum gloeosporioides (strain Cg-14) TaxID=1237896 RepID=T0KFZ5_COLGC|nr:hypothetical protein CGLO_09529 [Colletotrichum gloeosporioides Cg-14]